MQAPPGTDQIEIVPLVIVTRTFPPRASSLPDVRDFVRRRLTPQILAEDDVRALCDQVADLLLESAGQEGLIQVSLRIHPSQAEVDVVFTPRGDDAEQRPGLTATAPSSPAPPVGAPAVSFAVWLSGSLRREGMTLEAAARRLDVSVKTVSRWVNGATEPRLRDLSRIREIFGELPFP
ncbi:helix-turn-helix domain-containing protein [Actinoplanes sp. NPDC000266]